MLIGGIADAKSSTGDVPVVDGSTTSASSAGEPANVWRMDLFG
jgi:hypothetical protein